MRGRSKPPADEGRERYLGDIAPLLEAARQVEGLSPAQKKQIRRRITRTVFGMRRLSFRLRLTPVLAALALLVLGGVAFATAQHLGLLPVRNDSSSSGHTGAPAPESPKRRGRAGRAASRPASRAAASDPAGAGMVDAPDVARALLPEVPDPLIYPLSEASTSVWRPMAEVRAPVQESPSPTAQSAMSAPVSSSLPVQSTGGSRPEVRVAMATPRPSAGTDPAAGARHVAALAPSGAVALPYPAPGAQVRPAQPLVPGPARFAPSLDEAQASSSPTQQPSAAVVPAEQATSAQKMTLGDQAMFAEALRTLRSGNNPSAALKTLRAHAGAYPHSVFAGERTALEVEAMLALHRDRDALVLLDGMSLDDLPRSGERFVVRGELRAAARRWREACVDFDHALARVSGSPAWHERALWGRGVARLRLGEREAGLADIESYLDTYPKGRFATEAAKFFPKK